MGKEIIVSIETEDKEDTFDEAFPITDEEYQCIVNNDEFFIFPCRVQDEIKKKYPGRWYDNEHYDLDGKCYLCI